MKRAFLLVNFFTVFLKINTMFLTLIALAVVFIVVIFFIVKNAKKPDQGNRPGA